ncbi:MAG: hypothetical protein M3Y17_11835 [Actinomycetota bacterium]|nr:hypothetical protein [Actinomycetota bacterium]
MTDAFTSLVGLAGAVAVAALVSTFLSRGQTKRGVFEAVIIVGALIGAAASAYSGIYFLHAPPRAHHSGMPLTRTAAPLLVAVVLLAGLSVASRLPESIRPLHQIPVVLGVLAWGCGIGLLVIRVNVRDVVWSAGAIAVSALVFAYMAQRWVDYAGKKNAEQHPQHNATANDARGDGFDHLRPTSRALVVAFLLLWVRRRPRE